MNPLLRSLKARQDIVRSKIEEEQQRLEPDAARVSALRRLGRHLVDQIAFLERTESGARPQGLGRGMSLPARPAGQ